MHVIPLGYRGILNGKPNITIQDPQTEGRKGFSVTPDYFEFLLAIDPTVSIERADARLSQLAELGIVALIPEDAAPGDLDVVPVPRSSITLEEVLDDGYRFGFGDGKSFIASEFGGRFLQLLDSHRTLGEIVATVKHAALNDESSAAAIAENERQGNSFDHYLLDEAYSLTKTLIDSGAATLEKKVG